METPKNNKFRHNKRKESALNNESTIVFEPQIASTAAAASPSHSRSFIENEFSPGYFPMSQDFDENIDVFWDWQSPMGDKKRRKARPKRLIQPQSPVFNFQRPSSSTHTQQNFVKLREELRALQEELAKPDDESCLFVSPQNEKEYKQTPGQQKSPELDDIFNDSLDDQLIEFSQQVEKEYQKENLHKTEKPETKTKTDDIRFIMNKYKTTVSESPKFQKSVIQRTRSENVIQTVPGKMEMHRTRSFEMATFQIDQKMLEEIEKNRQAALALRQAKNKSNVTQSLDVSPVKFTAEEIEAKRQQALAKLEQKRLQELCEKNRQDALQRLQRNRMRKANSQKGSLDKKL